MDHQELINLTEKYFGNLKPTQRSDSTIGKFDPTSGSVGLWMPEKADFSGSDIRVKYNTMKV